MPDWLRGRCPYYLVCIENDHDKSKMLIKLCLGLAKPFVPPTADMPLRFRYTTYMGEQHPAEKKVVLEFCPADMPDLSEWQREKLKKLAGVRYNPEKDIIKMSCEMFETQAQNKRYLGDVVDSLLREARVCYLFYLLLAKDHQSNIDRTQRTSSRTCHYIPGITTSSQNPGSPRNG